MANLARFLHERARQTRQQTARTVTGTLLSVDRGQWRVSVAGSTFLANSGISQTLRQGDHVTLILGSGTPTIIGLLGRDENA